MVHSNIDDEKISISFSDLNNYTIESQNERYIELFAGFFDQLKFPYDQESPNTVSIFRDLNES